MISIDEMPDCKQEGHTTDNGQCTDCYKKIVNGEEKVDMNEEIKFLILKFLDHELDIDLDGDERIVDTLVSEILDLIKKEKH